MPYKHFVPNRSYSENPLAADKFTIIHFFTKNREELQRDFRELMNKLIANGALWISWPKRSSGIATDVNETIVREIGLDAGLVDVKVIAVDEVWSGLKFVYRLKDRV